MTTIDLSVAPPPPTGLLEALPRRVALTLPELRLAADLAGGAPLPFVLADAADEVPGAAAGGGLEGRLGASRATQASRAYREALTALHDPRTTLVRRGLLDGDRLDRGLAGAIGLLATPRVALDIDVAVEGVRAKVWYRQAGEAVASLATTDGIVFELAWFPASAWSGELARVAVLPEDVALRVSQVPDHLDVPYALADAAVEASGTGRSDLLQHLVAQHAGDVRDGSGAPLREGEVASVLGALALEAQGRLRALVADVSHEHTTVVGVRSWVLVADGWRTLHLHGDPGRVEVRAVDPSELAADLAPVLAEVTT